MHGYLNRYNLLMILPIHITIALISVLFSTYVLISPTKTRLNISYALIALTLISGTYLVVITPAHMLQACASGLLFVAVTSAMSFAAHRKLVSAR